MGSVPGQAELCGIMAEARRLIRVAILFSVFVNLLMLTSPLFMLQVYDRVLGSQSEETLLALVVLMTFLVLMMAALDLARARLMSRVAARLTQKLEERVFLAALSRAGSASRPAPLAELDAFTRFYATPGFLALIDLPWVPVFLAATALFHPWLGLLALGGGAVLTGVTVMNQRGTALGLATMGAEAHRAELMAARLQAEAEVIAALGMRASVLGRWQRHRRALAEAGLVTNDAAALWSTFGRNFRLYLQSAILALAALLVLRGEASGGVMVASSILTGRALAPVDQLLAHWPLLLKARAGRQALIALLTEVPPSPQRLPLPRPAAKLRLSQLSVTLAGNPRPSLIAIDAEIGAGQALAVIGASGSGKTTLARCLTGGLGLSPLMLTLGDAPLAAYGSDLGRWIGYLPQSVHLFDGTIAENIARLAPDAPPAAIIEAASRAGLHQQILALPQGYETPISAQAPQLSGGQIQRIGLARALYGDPVLVVLDEPDSHLDHDGVEALSLAVQRLKAEGKIVVIMAHRPAAIRDCDMILLLEAGQRRAFGPAADMLRAMLRQQVGPQPATPSADGPPTRPGQPENAAEPETRVYRASYASVQP